MGSDRRRAPEAYCSWRGHYKPKMPRIGVPRSGVPRRGHCRHKRPTRLPTGWHLQVSTFFRVQLERVFAFPANKRRGPDERNRGFGFASCSRGLVFPQEDNTGSACRDLVFPDGDIAGPNSNTAFDPSLEYSTNRVMLFWQPPPYFSPQPLLSFVVDDVSYARADKCIMAEKANFCQDHLEVALIMTLPDPSTYERIGRAVRNFDSAAGDREKKDAVL